MKVVVQRVSGATLKSDDYTSSIGFGLLVLVGVGKNDTPNDVKYLAQKITSLRIFDDEFDKCNLSIQDVDGEIMVVSNFTLQGRLPKGTRPDFMKAAGREVALGLYESLIAEIKSYNIRKVEKGSFGNHMDIDVSLNGPYTFELESEGR